MHFESLPNDLLVEIFEYFNAIEVLRIFHGLNNRLNDLIVVYLEIYSLDFRSLFKKDFDLICLKKLPLVSHQIKSIHLSDDDDTPEQPNLFFFLWPSFSTIY